MRTVLVEACEVGARDEGTGGGRTARLDGHMAIVLRDVNEVPQNTTFKLVSVDPDHLNGVGLNWYEGEHQATEAVVTAEGLELRIGPDVARNPLLFPGTEVEIEVAGAGVRGAFRWPLISRGADEPARCAAAKHQGTAIAVSNGDSAAWDAALNNSKVAMSEAEPTGQGSDAGRGSAAHSAEYEGAQGSGEDTSFQDTGIIAARPRLVAWLSAGAAAAIGIAWLQLPADGPTSRPLGEASAAVLMQPVSRGPDVSAAAIAARDTVDQQPAKTADAGLFEAFSAAGESPGGVDAGLVDAKAAMIRAQELLAQRADPRKREEAVFWLKRYLLVSSGAKAMRKGLRELGSAYAMPGRQGANFTQARLAWEMSAALGDPAAMCMLAALHQHGVGLVADMASATRWYMRADAAGGSCFLRSTGDLASSGPEPRGHRMQ